MDGLGFSGFRGGKSKPTLQNRFLVVKTHRQPAGVVESAGFESDPVGSSDGSGYRINLDSPTCESRDVDKHLVNLQPHLQTNVTFKKKNSSHIYVKK